MAKGKFVQVQRQMFSAHIVERAHNSPLEQRPERFDRLRVNLSANVLTGFMINDFMRVEVAKIGVAFVRIGGDQRHLVGDGLFYERAQGVGARV